MIKATQKKKEKPNKLYNEPTDLAVSKTTALPQFA